MCLLVHTCTVVISHKPTCNNMPFYRTLLSLFGSWEFNIHPVYIRRRCYLHHYYYWSIFVHWCNEHLKKKWISLETNRIKTFARGCPPASFSEISCSTLPESTLNIVIVIPEQTKGQLILSHLLKLAAYRCFRRLFNTVICATTK